MASKNSEMNAFHTQLNILKQTLSTPFTTFIVDYEIDLAISSLELTQYIDIRLELNIASQNSGSFELSPMPTVRISTKDPSCDVYLPLLKTRIERGVFLCQDPAAFLSQLFNLHVFCLIDNGLRIETNSEKESNIALVLVDRILDFATVLDTREWDSLIENIIATRSSAQFIRLAVSQHSNNLPFLTFFHSLLGSSVSINNTEIKQASSLPAVVFERLAHIQQARASLAKYKHLLVRNKFLYSPLIKTLLNDVIHDPLQGAPNDFLYCNNSQFKSSVFGFASTNSVYWILHPDILANLDPFTFT